MNKIIIGFVILGCALGAMIYGSILIAPAFVPVVNAEPTPDNTKVTYHLGDMILESEHDRYFFHGYSVGMTTYNVLLIGHQTIWEQGSVWMSQYSGMSNMEIPLSGIKAFYIGNQGYEIVEQGETWITLRSMS